jgi:hypothetical protein
MSLEITAIVLAVGLALSGVALWHEHRPRKHLDVRLIPTTPILIIGVVITLAAIVHLLSFLGKH